MMYKNTPIVRRGVVLIFVFLLLQPEYQSASHQEKQQKEQKGLYTEL